MPLPINIEDLLHKQKIESNRIEFKKGWNPDKIYHSSCAFANDIDNIGGGYILVGVEEDKNDPQNDPQEKKSLQERIIELIKNNNKITRDSIAHKTGISVSTVKRELKKMPMVKYVGSGYSGHWEIIEEQ